MKNTFGNSLLVTIFGESHGEAIGVVMDGLAPGIVIDRDFINAQLKFRRPAGKISTARVETDEYRIVSGVYNGKSTGTPLCIMIPNTAMHSSDYDETSRIARPGHADYAAFCKYHGFEDYHGGGHFSGRITAGLVAGGAIAISALKEKGIFIGTHIQSLGNVKDRDFSDYSSDIFALSKMEFPVLDSDAALKMRSVIESAASDGDSVGGVLESVVIGMPEGVGEPWFDTVEGVLSHALFSIPAIKGVQFGAGFDMVNGCGSAYNDPFRSVGGKVVTTSNNNGGINGGITNGMPITFRLAVKPTPSIYKEQKSVDIYSRENADLSIKGRHDPAIIHRARVVVDSVTALTLYDMLAQRFGTDYFFGGKN